MFRTIVFGLWFVFSLVKLVPASGYTGTLSLKPLPKLEYALKSDRVFALISPDKFFEHRKKIVSGDVHFVKQFEKNWNSCVKKFSGEFKWPNNGTEEEDQLVLCMQIFLVFPDKDQRYFDDFVHLIKIWSTQPDNPWHLSWFGYKPLQWYSSLSFIANLAQWYTFYESKLPFNQNEHATVKKYLKTYLLDADFDKGVELILNSKGHVVVSGIGKSGHVGRKISATLASTGTPSLFLHPAEAIHGDLGMIKSEDIIILISYSGETEEVLKLLPSLKKIGNNIISLTGKKDSSLANFATANIDVSIDREACPLNLAPTTSAMLTMTAGDALSVSVMNARGFAEEDFALTHPGGSLGKGLTQTVADNMISTKLPLMNNDQFITDAIIVMTESKLGLAIIHKNNYLQGIITDGDLRRLLLENQNLSSVKAENIMTTNPLTITKDKLMIDAKNKMLEAKVQALVVTDENNYIQGVIQIY